MLRSLLHHNIVQVEDVSTLGFQDVWLAFELLKRDVSEVLKDLKRNGQIMPVNEFGRYSSDVLEGLQGPASGFEDSERPPDP